MADVQGILIYLHYRRLSGILHSVVSDYLALWQAEMEGAATPRLALDSDFTSVGMDDSMNDRQPEPCPAFRFDFGL